MHDGVEWVATVGRRLNGTRWKRRSVKGQIRDVPKREYGSGTVVAIFAGTPFKVWLDTRALSERKSIWANPIWTTDSLTLLVYYVPAEDGEASRPE